ASPGPVPAATASSLPRSLPELLWERVRLTPQAQAYRQFDRTRREWQGFTWAQIAARVVAWRRALQAEGFAPGARVGLLVPNGVDHVCMDQAALALGLVPVPLHVIDNPESLAFVLADSGASLLLVDSAERWRPLAPLVRELPELRRVVALSGVSAPEGVLRSLADWLTGGMEVAAAPLAAPPPEMLAAIVYTSGTTGRPKGVMLSHRNVLADVGGVLQAIPVLPEDVFLSFLPLSHTLERTAGYYLPMAAGASVAFARSVPQLMEDLASVRPSVLVSVPRIYERAHLALRELAQRHRLQGKLLAITERIGWQRFEHARGAAPAPSFLERLLWPVLERRVAAKVRARFGGRLRAAVTGGAAIPMPVVRSLLGLGVPLLQGYGLTESAPVIACNTPEDNDPASVGRPLPGIEVRIGAQEELLVRGPNVMVGYWQRPEETARVLEPDGWLHTGDQVELVGGRLYIKGRIKDILVTSTGEKIAPVDLEAAITGDPLFEQALVVGEGRPYVAVLAVVNREQWQREAATLGLDAADPKSLEQEAVQRLALERIAAAARSFPIYARPRAVALSAEPWTVAAGLITPTLKPKRAAIERRFAEVIAQLYRGHS
ncbi:MAG TPA: AMP-dependent synthetase/ligase, partial [Steroidobacteraceae bacterium]|nr:AMP-dependent synthetase/ligase [Steroidobacteraceae bacterium]